MKTLFLMTFCALALTIQAQTEKELIGKWKLVKLTKDGQEKDIMQEYKTDQVYQVFNDDHKFEGIVGEKTGKGKWSLSNDNKELKIKMGIIGVKFTVDYFDAKRRIISSDKTGTLEYAKVDG